MSSLAANRSPRRLKAVREIGSPMIATVARYPRAAVVPIRARRTVVA
jgi:hypothetical protein